MIDLPANDFADIHTHIMFGVDDGASDFDRSKEMMRVAYEDGTRYICLTSHYKPQIYGTMPTDYSKGIDSIKQFASENFPGLTILLGNEIYFHHDIIENLESNTCLSLNGSKYVLTEADTNISFSELRRALSLLLSVGYKPVLAHVERYDCLRNKDAAEEMSECGVLFQANAGAVTGECGLVTKVFLKKLLKRRLIWAIASDAHDTEKYPPKLKKCADYVAKKYGRDMAERLFINNPLTALGYADNI